MTEPYLRTAGGDITRGIFIYGDAELEELVTHYHRLGHQVSLHAIGDAAIEQSIRAVARALAAHPRADHRHRIEHGGFSTPAQVATMQRLGMTLAPQPVFLYEFGDLYVDVLGERRPQGCYPMRSWLAAGLRPAASTDAPVSSSNPMHNLYPMVTRKTRAGRVLGANERLTVA